MAAHGRMLAMPSSVPEPAGGGQRRLSVEAVAPDRVRFGVPLPDQTPPRPLRARSMSGLITRALSFVAIGAMLAALWAADASAQGGASKGAPAVYKPVQRVEAREGDEWSPATVVKREGRKYQ